MSRNNIAAMLAACAGLTLSYAAATGTAANRQLIGYFNSLPEAFRVTT